MLVLGLSGGFAGESWNIAPDVKILFTHDAAACLIRDGELVAAVEEERLNRVKKTSKFPVNAIRACLAIGGVSPSQIDTVGHYYPEFSLDRVLDRIYLKS